MIQVKKDECLNREKRGEKVLALAKHPLPRRIQRASSVLTEEGATGTASDQQKLEAPQRCEADRAVQKDDSNTWASLTLATGAARRARGLLLSGPDQRTLLLVPCNDVHTVGMRHPIDVAFLDRAGRVIEAHCKVGPMRRLRNNAAAAVVERFASCTAPWFSVGDQATISTGKEEQ